MGIMGAVDSVGDVISKIAKWGAGEGSGISQVMRSSEKEIAQNLAGGTLKKQFNSLNIKAANDITLPEVGKQAERVIKKGDTISAKSIEDVIALQKAGVADSVDVTTEAGKRYKAAMDAYTSTSSSGSLADEALRSSLNRGDKGGIGYMNLVKGYYGDSANGTKRIGATVAGAGIAAVGVRTLQGGNLTTTAQGERNIAGIPFI